MDLFTSKIRDKDIFFNFVKDKSLSGPNNRVYIFKEATTRDDVIFY